MEHLAVPLVLAAAFLHAVTNALVKISDDPLLIRGFMSAVAALVMLPVVAFAAPPGAAAWPFLAGSVLVHALYPFLVAAAYRRGDLSMVFPVARGISPLGVLLLVVVLGGAGPTAPQLAGVLLICVAIMALVVPAPGKRLAPHGPAVGYACATGIVVAVYTYLDGRGLQAAATVTGYIAWLVVLDGVFTSLLVAGARRATLVPFVKRHWKQGIAASALGLLNFAMAMYALGIGPLVEIAALRETSVIFAAFLGTRVLGEGQVARRTLAAAGVLAGVALLQIMRHS